LEVTSVLAKRDALPAKRRVAKTDIGRRPAGEKAFFAGTYAAIEVPLDVPAGVRKAAGGVRNGRLGAALRGELSGSKPKIFVLELIRR
jgi:hypothetical protein